MHERGVQRGARGSQESLNISIPQSNQRISPFEPSSWSHFPPCVVALHSPVSGTPPGPASLRKPQAIRCTAPSNSLRCFSYLHVRLQRWTLHGNNRMGIYVPPTDSMANLLSMSHPQTAWQICYLCPTHRLHGKAAIYLPTIDCMVKLLLSMSHPQTAWRSCYLSPNHRLHGTAAAIYLPACVR